MAETQRVRVRADPGRVGRRTGRTREAAGRKYVQIEFPDGTSYLGEDQIEPADELVDLFDVLRRGELGRSSDLRRLLTHVRMRGKLANLIYSMETTYTDFYAYQFKPVIKLLETPTKGILIADEVGLGKTIEAGLIWTELRSRADARRLMIVCPSVLREKWRGELARRFGIEAEVLNAEEVLRKLRWSLEEQPGASFCIVAGMQGLRPRRDWDSEENANSPASKLAKFLQERKEDAPFLDLLVVDEAHYLRNPETKTHELGELLTGVAERVVFLSATPIHLKSEDLYHLLSLLDPDTFNSPMLFDSILEANAPIIRSRELVMSGRATQSELRTLLAEARQNPYLKESRQLSALFADLPSTERLQEKETISDISYRLDAVNLLSHVVSRTRKREVSEWRVRRQPVAEKVPMTPAEHAFYTQVTAVVRAFCDRYEKHEGFLLVTPQRQMASSMPAALRSWKRRELKYQEQVFEDLGATEVRDVPGPVIQELISQLDHLGDIDELWKNDSKFVRLAERLTHFLATFPDEKVVVFSYFKDTLKYLSERLTELQISTVILSGDVLIDKDEVLARFAALDGPRVLLSSEVGSEGVDLQFCRVMVNYDLPWNPMRVEQRIGRLDRIGQKADKILIWNLMYDDTIDSRIYDRLFLRLQIFEQALGGLEAVLGDELMKLTAELMNGNLTAKEEEERIEQSAQAFVNKRNIEERLENDAASLVGHSDYILNQIRAAKELHRWISGEDIKAYVIPFLRERYPGCVLEQVRPTDPYLYRIGLSNEAKASLERFVKDQRLSVSSALTRYDSALVECRFENRVTPERSWRFPENISQFHPLVRFVSSSLSQEKRAAYPVVAAMVSQFELPEIEMGEYVFAIQRWSVEGIIVRETLHFLVKKLVNGSVFSHDVAERIITTASLRGQDWLEARNTLPLEEAEDVAVELSLEVGRSRFERYSKQVGDEMIDRASVQKRTIERHLEQQRARYELLRGMHNERAAAARAAGDRVGDSRFSNLAKAAQSNLDKLLNRFEREMIRVSKASEIKVDCEDICVGVICVR